MARGRYLGISGAVRPALGSRLDLVGAIIASFRTFADACVLQ